MRKKAPIDRDDLAKKLIEDDLLSSKLLTGISAAGLSYPDYFYTNINEKVFRLIGYAAHEINDDLKDWYFSKIEAVKMLPLPLEKAQLRELALDIFAELKMRFVTFKDSIPTTLSIHQNQTPMKR